MTIKRYIYTVRCKECILKKGEIYLRQFFLMPTELIAIIIRNSSEVHSLTLNEQCIKLCQLTDDMN